MALNLRQRACVGTTAPCRVARVPHSVVCMAGDAPSSSSNTIALLKKAASAPGSVPGRQVMDAVVALEKEKRKPNGSDWLDAVSAPNARWKLVYTADSKEVIKAVAGKEHGSGTFFPITACQKFDGKEQTFENGVFLGPIFSLTFKGPFTMNNKLMHFDVTTMSVGLGPWRPSFPLKKGPASLSNAAQKDLRVLPFFIYAYADDEIVVARGRSGGLALWKNMAGDVEWQAKAGVMQIYS